MTFLTVSQARSRLSSLLGEDGKPRVGYADLPTIRFSFEHQAIRAVVSTAVAIVDVLGPWEEAWLWVDEPDCWNRELLPLYYRVRHSYWDTRLLADAPVHYFTRHESSDLIAFVVLSLLNEWAASLVTSHDYGRIRLTASQTLSVARSDSEELDAACERLRSAGLERLM